MIRTSLHYLCCALVGTFPLEQASAQLVYIPDADLRTWLEAQAPGSVDGDGFLDTSLPSVLAVDTAILYINWGPYDLTGLDQLVNLDYLDLSMGGNEGVFPALPASLRWLHIHDHPSSVLPSLPASLRVLELGWMPLTELPPLPPQLESLSLGVLEVASIGPFPASLNELKLLGVWPLLTEIVSFPVQMKEFHVLGSSLLMNVDCLPMLPDGMELFYLDVTQGPAFQCMPNIPTDPDFQFGGGPIPPLCETGVHSCALTTATSELESQGVRLSPVPARDEVFLDLTEGGSISVEIVDALGAVIYRGRTDGLRTPLAIGSWAPGTYAVVVDNGKQVLRFMKE